MAKFSVSLRTLVSNKICFTTGIQWVFFLICDVQQLYLNKQDILKYNLNIIKLLELLRNVKRQK